MHEGPVSAALGLEGIPSVSESTTIARDAALAGYEGGRIHVQHLSAAESVDAVRTAKAAGVQISCEASPHHLCLTDEEVRSLDPTPLQDEPAAAHRGRPPGADRGAARRHDRLRRHRPRPARGRGKGRPLRGGGDGGHRAGDGVRRPAHRARDSRCARSRPRGRANVRRGRALRHRAPDSWRPEARPTSPSATSRPSGRSGRTATRAAPRTPGAPVAGSPGRW